jgi:hypothetical protein
MQREIAFAGSRRCYLDIWSFLGTKTIPERVEDLSLGKATGASGVVGSQVFWTPPEARLRLGILWSRPDLEILLDTGPSRKESLRGRIVAAAMTLAARVAHHELSSQRDLR